MYSPHPSYPPLDLAASGAVVVTNRFAGKTSLEHYSPNILCADLDRDALVRRLAEGAELAADASARAANLARSRFERDWSTALAPVLDRLEAWADARAVTEA